MEIASHSRMLSASGFTLIELMVVISLVAVLLVIAGPSFFDSLQRGRQQSAVGRVGSAIAFARGEAVVRADTVSMCPTVDLATCSGSSWETGWLTFVDDGEGSGGVAEDGVLNGDEELLSIGDGPGNNITLRSVGFLNSASMLFSRNGRLLEERRGTVVICDARGADSAQGLIVNVSGQRRLAVDGNGDGVREDHNGDVLTCP